MSHTARTITAVISPEKNSHKAVSLSLFINITVPHTAENNAHISTAPAAQSFAAFAFGETFFEAASTAFSTAVFISSADITEEIHITSASSSARDMPHMAENTRTVTAAQRWNLILRSCLTACITPEKAYVKLLKKAFSSFSIGCKGNVS